ncbi:MAG TPA: hypothetical protein VFW11_14870 [Cyclobacteriaceae bacterium]|nr:hypothetical protein [Cyclobacteriaceae bacterium]
MKNMQKQVLKIQGILLFLLSFTVFATAQTSSYRLHTADSLYERKQYTQSLEHYEAILKNNEFTPAMFLKMAYVYEGLGQIGRALYYLDRYQHISGDRTALVKMSELAEKYQLEGYETSDIDFFITWYQKAYPYFTFSLAAFLIFLLALAIRQRSRHTRPVGVSISMLIVGLLFTTHLYYGANFSHGILADSNTFIMSGPSPGSNVVERVGEGHRLDIIGQDDVWLRVRWRGQVAYVKGNDVLRL